MPEITACRSCGNLDLEVFLDLGLVPLANSLLSQDKLTLPEETYPLKVSFCPNCSLVQITETVSPQKLFSDYLYLSSYSDTMLSHAQDLTSRLIREYGLTGDSYVIEVASNDGYLLQYYRERNIPVLGVEPAANVASIAIQDRKIQTLVDYFTLDLAISLRRQGKLADIIHAHNVLAHVPDPNDFLSGIATLLKPTGIVIIEVPYVRDLIENNEFDTIYHEHLCYFSASSLDNLLRRNKLFIFDLEHIPIHGGSLRLWIRSIHSHSESSEAVNQLLEEEEKLGLKTSGYYRGFSERVDQLRVELVDLLSTLKQKGNRIAGYGASAKGSTLLNYFNITNEIVEFIVDRNPIKQGLYTPGTHIPIYPPDALSNQNPDYTLMLTWNFANEIIAQQINYIEKGGKFIIPIPAIRIIDQEELEP